MYTKFSSENPKARDYLGARCLWKDYIETNLQRKEVTWIEFSWRRTAKDDGSE
jgi:hypothetical protein